MNTDSRFQLHRNSQNVGASSCFVQALSLVPEKTKYLAFCDQDDVWHPSKISEQIRILEQGEYLLTFCDRALIDSNGSLLTSQKWVDPRNRDQEPTLEELIFRNTIGGNSMMFDFQAIQAFLPLKLGSSSGELRPLFFHDALIAALIAMNGKIFSDRRQLVLYRQHENNLVGHSSNFEVKKIIHLMKSSRRTAQERIQLLQTIQNLLSQRQNYNRQLESIQHLKRVYQNPLMFMFYGLELCLRRPQFIKHYILLVLGITVLKVKPL